jgi:hypothetical protein
VITTSTWTTPYRVISAAPSTVSAAAGAPAADPDVVGAAAPDVAPDPDAPVPEEPVPVEPLVEGSGPCPVVVVVGEPPDTTLAAETASAAVDPDCPVLVGYMKSNTKAAMVLNAPNAIRFIATPAARNRLWGLRPGWAAGRSP